MKYTIATAAGTGRFTFGLETLNTAINIPTIAHALAQINRYTGHAVRPNSVAEHSLLAVEIAERDLGVRNPSALLAVLLHDAHEAFVGDVSTPLKDHMRALSASAAYDNAEAAAAYSVRHQFGLLTAFAAWDKDITTADRCAMATERRDLMPYCDFVWPALEGYAPAAWVNLRDRDHMTWTDWRDAFADRAAELIYARALRSEATGVKAA